MGWNDEKVSKWFKIKEGDEVTFTVIKIEKRQGTEMVKPLFKDKDYFYEFETDKGLLTVNNIGLFFALQEADVNEGDTVKVRYIKKGSIGKPSQFEVTKEMPF